MEWWGVVLYVEFDGMIVLGYIYYKDHLKVAQGLHEKLGIVGNLIL